MNDRLVIPQILILLFTCLTTAAAEPKSANLCREKISSIICEVAPLKKMSEHFTDHRKCLKTNTQKYQQMIRKSFDRFPEFLKLRFCSLKKIYIEKEFFGAAWSNPVDEAHPTEFLIGLRKSDLDASYSWAKGRTLFDRQSFGERARIRLRYQMHGSSRLSATDFTLLHELGHTFDYERALNRSNTSPDFSQSWTALGWEDIYRVKIENEFPLRTDICLNNCRGKFIDKKNVNQLYTALFAHGFISQLSATSAMEDFAESFAFYIAAKYMGIHFVLHIGTERFDLFDWMTHSPIFKSKKEFLDKEF